MKRTDWRIPLALLAAGIAVYFGVQAWRFFADPFSSTLAYAASYEETLEMTGWVVRQETVLPGAGEGSLRLEHSEGARVAKGGTVATVYASQEDLDQEEERAALEDRLRRLRETGDAGADAHLDDTVFQTLLTYRQDLFADRLDMAERQGERLRDLAARLAPVDLDELAAETAQAERRLEALSAPGPVRQITAPVSGLYSAVVDGYEDILTPESLSALSPSRLEHLEADAPKDSAGKLVLGDAWYYAATVSAADAEKLGEYLGRELKLRFSKNLERDYPMTLMSLGQEEDGRLTAVFSSREYLSEVTLLRRQTAVAVYGKQEGLRVPREALRLAEDGSGGVITGLYCILGAEARFKPVEVLYTGDGFLLVRSAAEEGQERLRLRAGDEVIVQASDLYDGKPLADLLS